MCEDGQAGGEVLEHVWFLAEVVVDAPGGVAHQRFDTDAVRPTR
jgi:hypothetical protein